MLGSREAPDDHQRAGEQEAGGQEAGPTDGELTSHEHLPAGKQLPSDQELPSDEELTRQLKDGYGSGTANPAAGDILYRRHREATLAYARRCCRDPHDAEDLVSEAFIRTFQAVRAGAGPQGAWRSYLLAVVRHTAIEWSAGEQKALPTPDFESCRQQSSAGTDPQQHLLASEDRQRLVRSFNTLPERWQAVLWHTLVENGSPHEVATLLGITPSGVTSLAFRAREGLRAAYLHAHLDGVDDDRCRHFSAMIGTAIRRGGTAHSRDLARHLAGCASCSRAYAELLALNATMRAAVAAGL
ncbi:sigma-70 family RNA polymerase sigma factor [Streptomyces sp. H10-C2]|uniref:RNA polymerase sigma factor n=1 Tax=unclassified Streptomyces TaxID=2593676 RepID=UPI0024BA5158|nr:MULTISPECIES: sigma-70 family RNA polymerase sigma factor [unclassified Streptomyces]MDJ0340955.1 sigma-70 family RNA polymerase sigma factor [Streptomyces sp. PH10-H1]MDJ0369813.1 sigma-70 family RNA polymerase sigma factor [Streptomyces sp. H10-C2]